MTSINRTLETRNSPGVRYLRILLDGFLVVCLIVGIGVFIYGLSITKTSPQWSGILVAASGILTGGVVLSFFLKAPRRMHVALLLLSSLISLFALNGFLRYYDLSKDSPFSLRALSDAETVRKAAEDAGVIWDTRSKLDVINEIRDSGHAAHPGGLATAYANDNGLVDSPDLLLPLANVSRSTIVLCNDIGTWVAYESDRYGFSNDDAIYDSKGPRILLIGDSFTQGQCVEQQNNIAGWLGKSGYSAINLGMRGSGPLLELARLREYGPRIAPDIVVWLYFGNDPDDIAGEYRFPLFRRYLEKDFSQGLIKRQDDIDALLNGYLNDKMGNDLKNLDVRSYGTKASAVNQAEVALTPGDSEPLIDPNQAEAFAGEHQQTADQDAWEALSQQIQGRSWRQRLRSAKPLLTMYDLRNFIGLSASKWSAPRLDITEDEMGRFRSILKLARDETAGFGGELYFVYLPSYEDVTTDSSEIQDRVVSSVNELGIPLLDFYSALDKHPNGLSIFPYQLPGHYTAEGYGLLAEFIIGEALESLVYAHPK